MHPIPSINITCVGEMSDAAEVLSAIYDSLAAVADGGQVVRNLFQWQVGLLGGLFLK